MLHKPVHEIASWPAWSLRLYQQYLAKRPPALDRIELLLAQIASMYQQAHKAKSHKAKSTEDFLPFRDPFRYVPDSGDPDVDDDIKTLMAAFGTRLVINH